MFTFVNYWSKSNTKKFTFLFFRVENFIFPQKSLEEGIGMALENILE